MATLRAFRLPAMTRQMRPRGPDAGGTFSQNRVAFGHRRLSIIDLAAASQQPMIDPELGLAIVFNGCIYNFRELRGELAREGLSVLSRKATPRSSSRPMRSGDRAASSVSTACLRSRSGSAIPGASSWRATGSVSSRSITRNSRAGFRFASTLPALLAAGDVDTAIDPAALHHYLSWHAVVPAPMTIIKGVRKLAPATICIIEPDGRRREESYLAT